MATRTRPAWRRESSPSTGDRLRQGAHQAAVKSTTTGSGESSTYVRKSSKPVKVLEWSTLLVLLHTRRVTIGERDASATTKSRGPRLRMPSRDDRGDGPRRRPRGPRSHHPVLQPASPRGRAASM